MRLSPALPHDLRAGLAIPCLTYAKARPAPSPRGLPVMFLGKSIDRYQVVAPPLRNRQRGSRGGSLAFLFKKLHKGVEQKILGLQTARALKEPRGQRFATIFRRSRSCFVIPPIHLRSPAACCV